MLWEYGNTGSWPYAISTALLSLIIVACLSFAGNADHTNKLNDKAIKSHGIGLRCIIVIFAVVVVIIVIILLDSMDVLSHCDTY